MMEKQRTGHTNEISDEERIKIIERSSRIVGRAVFFSILITLISFAPILFLEGQEKKLFSPLVWTKTFTMIGSVIVCEFESEEILLKCLENDPYSKGQVWETFEISRCKVARNMV